MFRKSAHDWVKTCFVCTGECHISPAVLAGMWREEDAKCKNLEEKMKVMLKGRGVCTMHGQIFGFCLAHNVPYTILH